MLCGIEQTRLGDPKKIDSPVASAKLWPKKVPDLTSRLPNTVEELKRCITVLVNSSVSVDGNFALHIYEKLVENWGQVNANIYLCLTRADAREVETRIGALITDFLKTELSRHGGEPAGITRKVIVERLRAAIVDPVAATAAAPPVPAPALEGAPRVAVQATATPATALNAACRKCRLSRGFCSNPGVDGHLSSSLDLATRCTVAPVAATVTVTTAPAVAAAAAAAAALALALAAAAAAAPSPAPAPGSGSDPGSGFGSGPGSVSVSVSGSGLGSSPGPGSGPGPAGPDPGSVRSCRAGVKAEAHFSKTSGGTWIRWPGAAQKLKKNCAAASIGDCGGVLINKSYLASPEVGSALEALLQHSLRPTERQIAAQLDLWQS
jgi:hypothetical protein